LCWPVPVFLDYDVEKFYLYTTIILGSIRDPAKKRNVETFDLTDDWASIGVGANSFLTNVVFIRGNSAPTTNSAGY
jgi:hypothetical protein